MRRWLLFVSFALLCCGNGVTAAFGKKPTVAVATLDTPDVYNEVKRAEEGYFKHPRTHESVLRYSPNAWLVNFLTMPFSFVLRRISSHLLFSVAVCVAVNHYYPTHPGLSIPMVGHSLLGSSLGLLLSYRTNAAYARFWEACGHWAKSRAICRNLALLIQAHIAPHAPRSARHFLQLLSAFPLCLMHLCLGGAIPLSDPAQALIPAPPSSTENSQSQHYQEFPALPALALCRELQTTLHHAARESRTSQTHYVEALHLNTASHLVEQLLDLLSSCEKIVQTPVPWTYSRHKSRFLTLWMGTLPFALVGTLSKTLTLVVVVAASYCMFGIEEIGHLIELPFVADHLEDATTEEHLWNRTPGAENGRESSALIKRGQQTKPYEIGIPVCSLAVQMRDEILEIAGTAGPAPSHRAPPPPRQQH